MVAIIEKPKIEFNTKQIDFFDMKPAWKIKRANEDKLPKKYRKGWK